MSRLWDRGESLDETVARFTVGRDPELDLQLVAHDALASAAHATMLKQIGVLSQQELQGLLAELKIIAVEAREGRFVIAAEDEDGHTAIETRLTAKLGDAGRRIHAGRSRNDQVIAALRLFGRQALIAFAGRLLDLTELLLKLAKEHHETTVPGYTHTRQAMPSTLGLLFAAHAEALLDAVPWIETAFDHLNRSPLGSASGYGVGLPLDRRIVAAMLAFDGVQINTLGVQNDRGKSEYLALGAVLTPVMDLARLAGDLIWFSSDELGFVKLSASVTTGSSIMPQKRNPDVLELIRASAAKLRQRHAEIAAVYAPLPSGYHRDLQLTKEPFVDGLRTCTDVVRSMVPVLEQLEVDKERCRGALLRSTAATDEVYRRVAAGEPFRTAYKAVATDPAGSVSGDATETWRSRQHLGAPGQLDLDSYHASLERCREWVNDTVARIASVWSLIGL